MARVFPRKFRSGFLTRSSPRKRLAPGWACRSRRVLLKNMAGLFSIKPKSGAVRPLASSCRAWRKTQMMSKPKILLVEDDAGIVGGLKKELQVEGYEVAVAERGDTGLAQTQKHAFPLFTHHLV